MRVFIGLIEVAGYRSRLAEGLSQIGIKVTFLTATPHRFGYADNSAPRWLQRWTHYAMGKPGSWIRETAKLFLILFLAATHRAFIFPYASSFNLFRPYGELRLLKWLRRKTIFVFHGSDSRPCFLERYGLYERDGKLVSCRTLLQRCDARLAQLRAIEKHASYLIANPLSAQWHIRECLNWFLIGIPSPEPVESPTFPERFRVLHSPSEPLGKGTFRIREAVESLKRKGHDFDYVELTGVSHETVLKELADCSLVIDQLYSDQPMAGLATEAAACGKASIVGSYGWQELHADAGLDESANTWPPVIECTAESFEQTLADCLANPDRCRQVGLAALDFIRAAWTPGKVARRFVSLFGSAPQDNWWFKPDRIGYRHGCTARPAEIALMVRGILNLDGRESLGLNHNVSLREALIDMAAEPADNDTLRLAQERIDQLEATLAERENKLANFRGMIERRDSRIEKLEKKLKLRKETEK